VRRTEHGRVFSAFHSRLFALPPRKAGFGKMKQRWLILVGCQAKAPEAEMGPVAAGKSPPPTCVTPPSFVRKHFMSRVVGGEVRSARSAPKGAAQFNSHFHITPGCWRRHRQGLACTADQVSRGGCT